MHAFHPLFPFSQDFFEFKLAQVIITKHDGHVYACQLSLHVNKTQSRHDEYDLQLAFLLYRNL